MTEELFFRLVSRKLAGEATIQEMDELQRIMKQNPDWELLYFRITHERADDSIKSADNAEAAYALHALKIRMKEGSEDREREAAIDEPATTPKRSRRMLYFSIGIAASLCLLFSGLYWYITSQHKNPAGQSTHEIVTRKGNKTKLKLTDGTQVWLNADSKLICSDNFSGPLREVWLTGEAYFDVVKDSLHPFIIHAEKINIRVLGTAFNVKSYPLDKTIETSLIRGRIEVTFTDRPMETVILNPNEKLLVWKDQSQKKNAAADPGTNIPKVQIDNINARKDSTVVETLWMQDKLSFVNESLETISQTLERRFDVEFEFRDPEVKKYTYTGPFEEMSLDKILMAISLSKHFTYKTSDRRVIISK
jgi:transmembrane sensor